MLDGIIKRLNNPWLIILASFILLETASILAFRFDWLEGVFLLIVAMIAGAVTAHKAELGAYLVLGELTVGGLGYLLFYPLGESKLSLRLGIFTAVFIVWLAKSLWRKKIIKLNDGRLIALAVFFIFFAWAAINGLISGYRPAAVFSDLNGYLFFGLIGLFAAARLRPMRLLQILFIGSLISGLVTIIALFLFSHGFAAVGSSFAYSWLRDSRVGEITLIAWPLFRIFFQSHIYSLLALVFSALLLLVRTSPSADAHAALSALNGSPAAKALLWLLAWFNFFVLVISQSRSFWLAGAILILAALPAIALYLRVSWQRVVVYLIMMPVFLWSSNLAGQAVIGDFQTNFISGRVSGSSGAPGVSSRMAELAPAFSLIRQKPISGQGFGSTIHFRSDDPRIKNEFNPDGWTDAPAIEWGYLDLAVKAGLPGLLSYLIFLATLAWPLLRSALQRDLLSITLLTGLLAILLVHMFTPYLNHPLGIGYLLAAYALTKKSA